MRGEATLSAINGMFALDLWCREENKLVLARHRIGEKPLYYGWQDNIFIYGSEFKSLAAHAAFKAHISRKSLSL